MKKRERVLAAIAGQPVDRIPAYFTMHFPPEVSFGERGVQEHIRFYEEVNPDIQKIMNEHLVPNMGPIRTPDDWNQIRTITLKDKFMADQVELVQRVYERMGKDGFNIGTLHGTVASTIHPIEKDYGYDEVRKLLCAHLREKKQPVLDAMRRIADAMAQLAVKYIEIGLDGMLYASLGGERFLFTDDEFAEYIAPLDQMILKAAQEAGGHNILHMCKTDVNFDRYRSYAGLYEIVNWGVYEAGLSLTEARTRFPDVALMGGLSNRVGPLVEGPVEAIAGEVQNVVEEAGRTRFILGTDCTLPTGTPYTHMRAAVDALETL